MQIVNEPWTSLPHDTRFACAELWDVVWPSEDASGASARLGWVEARSRGLDDEVLHLAFDLDDRVVAVARTFGRTIENDITTSKPGAVSFWEPSAMIHPADADWDDSLVVDLRVGAW